jgi:choline dehydrogenase-like flavoprotein
MESHRHLRNKFEEMLRRAGAHPLLMEHKLYIGPDVPIGGTAHQAGTASFGTDPATSVLDINCKAHDMENLYIADAILFRQSARPIPR